MSENTPERHRQLAVKILANASDKEKVALREWVEQLLAIKRSDFSKVTKGKEAIQLTSRSKVIVPILKIIAREFKLDQFDISKIKLSSYKQATVSIRQFWSKRTLPAKLGIGVSTVAMIIFGQQGAGIAALGTAIGVPLWVVFGAGATFAGVLYEELTGRKPDITTTYTVIEAIGKPENNLFQRIKNLVFKK